MTRKPLSPSERRTIRAAAGRSASRYTISGRDKKHGGPKAITLKDYESLDLAAEPDAKFKP